MEIEKAYPEAYSLARRFHEFYEQSAPAFGYETKSETKEFDPESPNGRLMAWVCFQIVKEEKQALLKFIKQKFIAENTIGNNTIYVFDKIVNGMDIFEEDFKDL
jgi:hypothetical protein